jgi:hypothetical protein
MFLEPRLDDHLAHRGFARESAKSGGAVSVATLTPPLLSRPQAILSTPTSMSVTVMAAFFSRRYWAGAFVAYLYTGLWLLVSW